MRVCEASKSNIAGEKDANGVKVMMRVEKVPNKVEWKNRKQHSLEAVIMQVT